MEIFNSINNVKEMTKNAKKLPMSDTVLINKYELLDALDMIRKNLPIELEDASRILQQKNIIIQEANREAEQIIKEAEQYANKLVAEHEITQKAATTAEEIMDRAKLNARELRMGAKEYANALLNDLNNQIEINETRLLNNLEESYNNFVKTLNYEHRDKVDSIRANIEELQKYK